MAPNPTERVGCGIPTLGLCGSSPLHCCVCLLILVSSLPQPATGRSHVRVTSLLVEPYLMTNPLGTNQTGNGRYIGYIPDLLQALADRVGFHYELQVVKDGQYGNKRPDNNWDGMIGELLRDEADLLAAPLYLTHKRREVLHFSDPFLTVHATVLLSKYHQYPGIMSAGDLLNQDLIQYGTLRTGVIINAFKHTNSTTYKTMWETMKAAKPSAFTPSNIVGIDRVRAGDYAFILPHTIGEYIAKQTHCDLSTLDRFLMKRNFALAVSKDSGLHYIVRHINQALRLLRQRGALEALYRKWWVDPNNCGMIKRSSVVRQESQYNVSSVGSLCRTTMVLGLICGVSAHLVTMYLMVSLLIM